jgi:hypothetical protein
MKNWAILWVLIMLLGACSGFQLPETAVPPTPTMVSPTETLIPTEISVTSEITTSPPTVLPTLTPQPPNPTQPQITPLKYRITAELDYGRKVVTAQQHVSIPNPAGQPLQEIDLVVQPGWYPGTFQLDELAWTDGTLITNYALEGIRLRIPLEEPWEPGTAKALSIAFTLNLPTLERSEYFGPNPFGYTSRQLNLTDWHPFVPPYVDGEWLIHTPWYYGEHLVYPLADYQAEIHLTNAPAGTVVAANALDQGTGDTHIYQIKKIRNFVLSVSPEYRVFQEDVDGVTLLGYSFPYEAEIGQAAFDATVEAYRLYNKLFGPYPHDSLTMIQADFLHGMEYDGLYFLSKAFYNTYDGTQASYLVAIAAHETAHQWWFGLVGNDQALEPWLDEAMCTFTERLYYELIHPDALDWWLEYRVAYYQPQGWVDLSIYDSSSYRAYRDAVYLNGMNFLAELRDLVGAEVFMEFLQDYLDRRTNEFATADDFFVILREHSDADWTMLKTQYFQTP